MHPTTTLSPDLAARARAERAQWRDDRQAQIAMDRRDGRHDRADELQRELDRADAARARLAGAEVRR